MEQLSTPLEWTSSKCSDAPLDVYGPRCAKDAACSSKGGASAHGGSESLLGEELQVARRRQWCRQTSQVQADCDYLRRLTSWDFQSLVATEASILGRDDARAPSNDAGRDRESARCALGCPRQRAYCATSSNSSLPLTSVLKRSTARVTLGIGLGFRDFSSLLAF